MTSADAGHKAVLKELLKINPNDYALPVVINLLKTYADLNQIPGDVDNRITREARFPKRILSPLFNLMRTTLTQYISSYEKILNSTQEQAIMYEEFLILLLLICLLGTSVDPEFLKQWTRCFSAHPYVASTMSQNGINSRMFGGNQKFFHFSRMPWSLESGKYSRIIQSITLLIKEKVGQSRIVLCNTKQEDEVDDLMFNASIAEAEINIRLKEVRRP